MLPGVCPRRWMTDSVAVPTGTVPPFSTSVVTGTGSSTASSGWATTSAPVASWTSASACQWSKCRCVVMIRRTGRSPISSSRRLASLAASISAASPVSVQVSR